MSHTQEADPVMTPDAECKILLCDETLTLPSTQIDWIRLTLQISDDVVEKFILHGLYEILHGHVSMQSLFASIFLYRKYITLETGYQNEDYKVLGVAIFHICRKIHETQCGNMRVYFGDNIKTSDISKKIEEIKEKEMSILKLFNFNVGFRKNILEYEKQFNENILEHEKIAKLV